MQISMQHFITRCHTTREHAHQSTRTPTHPLQNHPLTVRNHPHPPYERRCNVDDEAMTKNLERLNSSCSPSVVSPGMAALLAHGNRREHALENSLSQNVFSESCLHLKASGELTLENMCRLSSHGQHKSESACCPEGPSPVRVQGCEQQVNSADTKPFQEPSTSARKTGLYSQFLFIVFCYCQVLVFIMLYCFDSHTLGIICRTMFFLSYTDAGKAQHVEGRHSIRRQDMNMLTILSLAHSLHFIPRFHPPSLPAASFPTHPHFPPL
jgi:hypothetical protein